MCIRDRYQRRVHGGNTQLQYKGRGDVDTEQKQENIYGTNRIVARELSNVKGMNATQQLALRNLQSMGKSRRQGQLDKDSPLKDLSQIEVQKYKNNMLNAVKNEEQEVQQYSFVKKEIGQKKLQQFNLKSNNEGGHKNGNDQTIDGETEKVIIINNNKKIDNLDNKITNDKPKGNSASKARQKLLLNL
eukprot:TRINITY_DN7030_c0_g1_i2.p1 TRINITY_DN7030_c0_g1~~TRINITY_DN7030_c0_g1_i2.p1  ORF type:complete len:188 (-),score=39.73 TRINITY_DN7030_c0_g1_i2:2-565(-)